jgi:hypothetical protein
MVGHGVAREGTMSATADNITDPHTLAEIARRAESERRDDDYRLRLAQALPAARNWNEGQMERFGDLLTPHALGFLLHIHGPGIEHMNPRLAAILRARMTPEELAAVVADRAWRWGADAA